MLCIAVCCSVLYFGVLQCVAVCCIEVDRLSSESRHFPNLSTESQSLCNYAYVLVYVWVCIYIHPHPHTLSHTHINTRTQTSRQSAHILATRRQLSKYRKKARIGAPTISSYTTRRQKSITMLKTKVLVCVCVCMCVCVCGCVWSPDLNHHFLPVQTHSRTVSL